MKISVREKIFFWIIVGMISVFFAEVVSGSTPYPFFTPLGWLIVFPVYELHILILGTIVLKYGKPTLYALYPAGMIFGMYESYITKVIWGSASWSGEISVGGIYLIPFILVVLFWHPFMSFIIPLTLSEITLTNSKRIISHMPDKILSLFSDSKRMRKTLILSSLFIGLIGMFNLNAVNSFLSSLTSSIFLLAIVLLWRKRFIGAGRKIDDYLPGKIGFSISLFLLALLYIIATFTFNPEYLPPPSVHAVTAIIYITLFILLWRNMRISRYEKERRFQLPHTSLNFVIFLILIFVLTTTLESLLFFKILIFVIFLIAEGIFGFLCLTKSIYRALFGEKIVLLSKDYKSF